MPFAGDFMGKPAWIWLVFAGSVISLLALDLGVLHRRDREIGCARACGSAGYIGAGLLFGAWVWQQLGAQSGMDYYTGFLIEKSLSMDNVFVRDRADLWLLRHPRQYQHRVLFWGILV